MFNFKEMEAVLPRENTQYEEMAFAVISDAYENGTIASEERHDYALVDTIDWASASTDKGDVHFGLWLSDGRYRGLIVLSDRLDDAYWINPVNGDISEVDKEFNVFFPHFYRHKPSWRNGRAIKSDIKNASVNELAV